MPHQVPAAMPAESAADEGLRERRRRETRREIGDAALDLISERGFAATTTDDIARRAGVSPRTFFRYFATKEAALLTSHEDVDEMIAAELSGFEPIADGHQLLVAVERVYRFVAERFDDLETTSGGRFLRVHRLVTTEPALRAAALVLDTENERALAEGLVGRMLPGVEARMAVIVVGAFGTIIRISVDEWVRRADTDTPRNMGLIFDDVLADARALLSAWDA